MSVTPREPQGPDAIRLSLLSQTLSEISTSVMFNIGELQQDTLLNSTNGLLNWLGLNSLERKLEKPSGIPAVLRKLAAFSHTEQVRDLGWMVQRAAANPKAALVYEGLVASLMQFLPDKISLEELRHLIDSMRGHMRHLAWVEPWLFRDVIFPLLQDNRAEIDHACEIWIQELVVSLGPGYENQHKLFDRAREGQTTNCAAFLFAHSSEQCQNTNLKFIRKILVRQRRFVIQPLASTANWTHWNEALVVATWILAFARWCQFYLRERGGKTSRELDELVHKAAELAMLRSEYEWQAGVKDTQSELTAFLKQVDGLLTA